MTFDFGAEFMSITITKSTEISTAKAAAGIIESLGASSPKFVLYFSSSAHDQDVLAKTLKSGLPGATLMGCSTSGEIVSGAMLKNSVVAMGLGAETITDAAIAYVDDVSNEASLRNAVTALEQHFGKPIREMSSAEYVGLVLIDGLSRSEETVMDRLGDWTDVLFVGGSAGDDLKFEKTVVHADGRVGSNSAVLALLKPTRGFDILKTQGFCSLGKELRATKVDEPNRTVYEFNGKPAAEAYAEALDISVEQAANAFMRHPVGLIVDEPFVRSPQQFKDGHMVFYCAVKEGMSLEVLESTDIISTTRDALDAKLKEIGPIRAIVNFNCILRTLELEQTGQSQAYADLFTSIPTVGFSTYGEEYVGHINQTATMLLLK
jgi:hypothetical protein